MAVLAAMGVTLVAPPALANGRFPAASQLVAHPRDPARMVLRTTYGLLVTRDNGTSWDWICERAVGYGGVEDPALAITGAGTLLAGIFEGLVSSSDEGCTWSRSPGLPQVVIDLAARPAAPDTVYAITGKYTGKSDAGSLFRSELHVTRDGGSTWSLRASLDATLLLESVEVAPSAPGRIYVTAVRDHDPIKRAWVLVSDDDGAHWAERAVMLEPSERAAFVAAVDPRQPDRVYLRTSGPETNRLLLTEDGGRTVRTLFRGGALLGFALSGDGNEVYFGGPSDGLQVAHAPAYRVEKRWAMPVQCLAVQGHTLWACSAPQSGFALGSSEDDGVSFRPRLTLAGMRGPVPCPGSSSMTKCAAEWDKLQADFGMTRPAPALADAGQKSSPSGARHCACSAPGAAAGSYRLDCLFGLACAGYLARRRASRG
jgi:hypothetical protein